MALPPLLPNPIRWPVLKFGGSDWLASYRPSLGRRTNLTLASFFIAGRDWLASYRPSFDRRTFFTLASFFHSSFDRCRSRVGLAVSACLDRGVAERRRLCRCRKAIWLYASRPIVAARYTTTNSACHSDCTSVHRASNVFGIGAAAR